MNANNASKKTASKGAALGCQAGELLPRLLLLSDEIPLQDGMGLSQTIYNLLKPYPKDRLMVYVPNLDTTNDKKNATLPQKHVAYRPPKSLILRNRLGPWINPYLLRFHRQQLKTATIQGLKEVETFSPEIVLVLCNTFEGLIMANRILEYFSIPVISYFMDDWMHDYGPDEAHAEVAKLLKNAASWIVVDQKLEQIFTERYDILPTHTLSLHNPVSVKTEYCPPRKQAKLEVVYAGSVWGMHLDALTMAAATIYELAQEGYSVSLKLYTRQVFWSQHLKIWEKYQVQYGGLLEYSKLHIDLQEASMLLVASSFQESHRNHSESSLQTKVTDYMLAGRALLAVGPDYSVCNRFVKKWDCGYIATSPTEIREAILSGFENREVLAQKGENAYNALVGKFDIETVFKKFSDHLCQIIRRNKQR